MDYITELKHYLDQQGRLEKWPSRRNKGRLQQLALEYLANQFEHDLLYNEQEVNALLRQHHTFDDPALLRRELFDRGLIDRLRDGSAYWLK
ncbi:DUF2087 domain-containing protein [Leptolyngbya sp. FACHB-711]|uniref:DUF2087 domain-containing protein n=1 Tax=Leptolyngbya sp. FACHB-711 TaxID=2692813 RepID=UPI0016820F17|nr:DUF2087 domain-containing protein [Leptolyngbya sp. FACHB-711]MBD1848481.1 DUF2087 domain-containing protein [Cyanobacteria bacterium FACHB-502]MBD2024963.1 DUF2087 domain-containing protein [Leptolyngbya sp. FACHB-711]